MTEINSPNTLASLETRKGVAFVDIDGVMVHPGHDLIDDNSQKALDILDEKFELCPSTGRSIVQSKNLLRVLCHRGYVATHTGSVISHYNYSNDEFVEVASSTINPEIIAKVGQYIKGYVGLAQMQDGIFNDHYFSLDELGTDTINTEKQNRLLLVIDYAKTRRQKPGHETLLRNLQTLKEQQGINVAVSKSWYNKDWVDIHITPPNVSKASANRFIINHLGNKRPYVVFGDDQIDAEALADRNALMTYSITPNHDDARKAARQTVDSTCRSSSFLVGALYASALL